MTWIDVVAGRAALEVGDCRELLRALPDASIDSVVTDPPYELGFMGKKWDASGVAYDVQTWREVLRILKPGGHLLAFGGTRTYHRMACAIEDAGFEIRDSIHWVYGTGFPKSLDVSKAIDKDVGHWRGRAGEKLSDNRAMSAANYERTPKGDPVTAAAAAWEGWGTALKPAHEPIVVARKPLERTVAKNVLAHGVGGLHVDACRVGDEVRYNPAAANKPGGNALNMSAVGMPEAEGRACTGRFPPNVLLSHSSGCVEVGTRVERGHRGYPDGPGGNGFHGGVGREADGSRVEPHAPIPDREVPEFECTEGCPVAAIDQQSDPSGASRFFPVFYCAKPSRKERDLGCAALPDRTPGEMTDREDGSTGLRSPRAGAGRTSGGRNSHPTVKPLELMRWLVRLVTPPGGCVLDPFSGSGTTGMAALLEKCNFLGCELDEAYARIAERRIRDAALD